MKLKELLNCFSCIQEVKIGLSVCGRYFYTAGLVKDIVKSEELCEMNVTSAYAEGAVIHADVVKSE